MADEFTKAALYWIKTFNKKVKEKIWIEKLIELLNEYENKDDDQQIEWRIWEWDKWENGKVRGIVNDVYMWWVSELVVCSAYYWFTKWLVENDKIDLEEIWIDYWRIHLVWEKNWRQHIIWQNLARYEALLMLLAISDTPIEDLISYLK